MVGGSTVGVLVKSTRPDLGDSSLGSVDGKREAKREKTVLVSCKPSAWSPSVSASATNSNGNSSVLATPPLDVLGVAVKRSPDKEMEGCPPKPS